MRNETQGEYMKKLYLLALLALILLILAACATNSEGAKTKLVTKYDIALVKVVNTSDLTGRAKSPVADTTLVNKLRYRYEDNLMRTIWSASETGFELTFYNASEKNVSINWEQGLYLDYDNIGHRLLLASTKDADKDKPQAASTIVPRGNIVETITSVDHVSMSNVLGVYARSPLLPTDYTSAVRYKGKEMKLILPISIDGITSNYEWTFKVIAVRQVAVKTGWLGL